MAARQKTVAAKKKQPTATQTSKSIQEQTEAFLGSGGEITQVNSGISGQQSVAGPKHISIGNKPRNS
jgi:hypothetical protein